MSRIHWSKKKSLVVVSLLFLMFVGVGVVFAVVLGDNQETSDTTATGARYDACLNDPIGLRLKSEFPNFDSSSLDAMKDLVAQIESKPDVTNSINCQYVLAKSAGHRGDLQKSIQHYQAVLSIYESDGRWVDPSVGAETPENLKAITTSHQETIDLMLSGESTRRVRWRPE